MGIIYTDDEIMALTENLDRENASYDIDHGTIIIRLDMRGSIMIIGNHRSFLIVNNPGIRNINLKNIKVNNVIFSENTLYTNYMMFIINKNNNKPYENYEDLTKVYYKLDYEIKTIRADEEEFLDTPDERLEIN